MCQNFSSNVKRKGIHRKLCIVRWNKWAMLNCFVVDQWTANDQCMKTVWSSIRSLDNCLLVNYLVWGRGDAEQWSTTNSGASKSSFFKVFFFCGVARRCNRSYLENFELAFLLVILIFYRFIHSFQMYILWQTFIYFIYLFIYRRDLSIQNSTSIKISLSLSLLFL